MGKSINLNAIWSGDWFRMTCDPILANDIYEVNSDMGFIRKIFFLEKDYPFILLHGVMYGCDANCDSLLVAMM